MSISNKNILIKIFIILLISSGASFCQHVRVRFNQDPPKDCMSLKADKKCRQALEERERLNAEPSQMYVIPQAYYYWGLSPKNYPIDTTAYCSNGVKEAHQYSTFFDSLYEQLTIGIYSPRTLVLICYN
nr:Bor family protein [Leptospira adleri]